VYEEAPDSRLRPRGYSLNKQSENEWPDLRRGWDEALEVLTAACAGAEVGRCRWTAVLKTSIAHGFSA